MNQCKSTRKAATTQPMHPYQNFGGNSGGNTATGGGRMSIKHTNGAPGIGSQFYQKKSHQPIPQPKNPNTSNGRLLSDQERSSHKSHGGRDTGSSAKPFANNININLLNNLNNINQAMAINSHSHSLTKEGNGNGSLGNSMLQPKKIGKPKKDPGDFGANNTANLTGAFGVGLGGKLAGRQTLNQKLTFGNHPMNSTQNGWKGK
jgi:hypothetical protein